jgi:hypothetical protein
MDKNTFLDSQLWLFRLSDEEMEGLQKDFKFFTLLADAYCCFQVDERLMFFTMDQYRGITPHPKNDDLPFFYHLLHSLDLILPHLNCGT